MRVRPVSVGTVELALLEAGDGGRPLLLVHGFTGAKEDFADQLDLLAGRGWHVVAPDLRGHGESSKPGREDAYDLEQYADDLVALVDALGWDRFALLGHSMGGMIAQVLALRVPDRIAVLVLMDTGHGPFEDAEPSLIELGIAMAREKGMDAIADVVAGIDDPLESPAARRLREERPGYAEFGDRKLRAVDPAMYAAMLTALSTAEDRLHQLPALTMPTLVVVGDQDRSFIEPSRRMADALPDARLVVIDDAGHSPQFEAPQEWFDAVTSFLEEDTHV